MIQVELLVTRFLLPASYYIISGAKDGNERITKFKKMTDKTTYHFFRVAFCFRVETVQMKTFCAYTFILMHSKLVFNPNVFLRNRFKAEAKSNMKM